MTWPITFEKEDLFHDRQQKQTEKFTSQEEYQCDRRLLKSFFCDSFDSSLPKLFRKFRGETICKAQKFLLKMREENR